MWRFQVVLLVVVGVAVGTATFASVASKQSAWVTVHAERKLDDGVSYDENLGVFLVTRGSRVIAFSDRGPWNNEPVFYCQSSQLFETRRSGSKFDVYGHYFAGPAPRGLSRYRVRMRDDDAQIIPGEVIPGPSRAVSRKRVRPPVGAYCIP